MEHAKVLEEFKTLKFKRDLEYFNDGYASWEVTIRNKKFYVHAIYQEYALYVNDYTKDYTNGIKGFEIQDSHYNVIKRIAHKTKLNVVSLDKVEEFLISSFSC